MGISSRFDKFHAGIRQNRWLRYFTMFTRIALAAGFLPSGIVKIVGQRFTALTIMHPMGHYLSAFYRTGFYYTFVGIMQVVAAVLLLVPATATLGAFLYFPIILNICMLSLSVRFEGSLVSSPLMVLANLYLLLWDYHKWKWILPFNRAAATDLLPAPVKQGSRFPVSFFAGGLVIVMAMILLLTKRFDIVPRNTVKDCVIQCEGSGNPGACYDFCDCIHRQGRSLDSCLATYRAAQRQALKKQH